MSKSRWIILGFAFLFTLEQTVWPQANHVWRYWTTKDGLAESRSRFVTVNLSGNIWVSHGPVENVSRLDGYSVQNIPSPGPFLPVRESQSGEIWSVYLEDQGGGLQQFKDGRWVRYEIRGVTSDSFPMPFLPLDQNRALLLLPDCLMELNVATRRTAVIKNVHETKLKRFNDMIFAWDGGIWIAAEGGAARFPAQVGTSGVASQCMEYPLDEILGIRDLRYPVEGKNGELFATALSLDGSKEVVIRTDGTSWMIVFAQHTENEKLVGMPGRDNGLWLIKGRYADPWPFERHNFELVSFSLSYAEKNHEQAVGRNRILSGELNDATSGPDDVLWLGTSVGTARYAYPVWRTPVEVAELDETCHMMCEDTKRRIWFACRDSLVLFGNGEWRIYPLPFRLWADNTESFCSLPDGRVVFPASSNLVTFDPQHEEFEEIQHPEGRHIVFIGPRRDGNIWIESRLEGSVRLEIYDGVSFQSVLQRERDWNIRFLRSIVEMKDGSILLSGTGFYGLAQYQDGKYRVFDSGDGYPGGGGYFMHDVGNGKIWVGGIDKIIEYDGNTFRIIKSGLEKILSAVTGRDGSIWVASGTGVHRFHNGSWVTNSAEDGLPDAAVYEVFEDSQGRVWAGTTAGISLYHPDADGDPPETYMVLEKNVERIGPDGDAQFVFTGMDKWKYTEVGRLLYSHRIDGGEWSAFAEGTVASATGLAPGPHRFEVKAMDRNWNIDPTPAVFDFSVALRWYREPAFIVIIALGTLIIVMLAAVLARRHLQLRTSNTQLQQANEELRELDKMKSAFVSQASHDLRTPLTAIKSSLDNLLHGVGGTLSQKHQRIVSRALGSADRLTDLINDVLDINRIEAGRMVLQKTEVPLNAIAQNALYENRPAADQKRIALHTKGLQDTYAVTVDPGKMERVVGELIGNAIKYTPEGGSVHISLGREGDDEVALSVLDTGIGMTSEECAKIFERFYRTPASQKMARGSGLGICIAKELIEMHGGTLTVDSEAGKGTVFTMRLPITAA